MPRVLPVSGRGTRALFALASEQAGYFTAAQAQGYGISLRPLTHYAVTERFIRVSRGLYRFRDYPAIVYSSRYPLARLAGAHDRTLRLTGRVGGGVNGREREAQAGG